MSLKSIDNEQEIIRQIAGGSEQAFAQLFHGYVNNAGIVINAIVCSREQTEEILQDVFVKLWKDREKLLQVKQFNAYLFIILRNHTLNYLTKLVTERKKQEEYFRNVLQQDNKSDERLDILDKAIDALPAQQRTVFLLRAQGYKNPEIANRMNLSTDSVKKYNQLALRFIHQFISLRVTILFSLAASDFFK
ncbi:sigma-70 family RNA polymerase sigma factor [Chitinophaga sp. G-6-1-13]|uniref:Sigma-70 family RNA polymerase sigma factor n=1 Tax=Chitinophaga fulva TaxID=2728842 RepID=A0A848GHR2_9BACT|nr:sigma-70 family RNA polymerase sigma factor [Chitinophaga fulva]NML38165.1 sigma-70 family RNA polymerase sigma factor [Chitinophaga fulva]